MTYSKESLILFFSLYRSNKQNLRSNMEITNGELEGFTSAWLYMENVSREKKCYRNIGTHKSSFST